MYRILTATRSKAGNLIIEDWFSFGFDPAMLRFEGFLTLKSVEQVELWRGDGTARLLWHKK